MTIFFYEESQECLMPINETDDMQSCMIDHEYEIYRALTTLKELLIPNINDDQYKFKSTRDADAEGWHKHQLTELFKAIVKFENPYSNCSSIVPELFDEKEIEWEEPPF